MTTIDEDAPAVPQGGETDVIGGGVPATALRER
jgi:hypothetical protein